VQTFCLTTRPEARGPPRKKVEQVEPEVEGDAGRQMVDRSVQDVGLVLQAIGFLVPDDVKVEFREGAFIALRAMPKASRAPDSASPAW
jgi:hypothetical protein